MASSCWYCISTITVARGDRPAQPEHVKTPRTRAWLLAVQGTATVNPDSQFNANSFFLGHCRKKPWPTQSLCSGHGSKPKRSGDCYCLLWESEAMLRQCTAHRLLVQGKVLSRLCGSCIPTETHLKPSLSVLLYSKPCHPTTHHACTPTSFHTQEESAL